MLTQATVTVTVLFKWTSGDKTKDYLSLLTLLSAAGPSVSHIKPCSGRKQTTKLPSSSTPKIKLISIINKYSWNIWCDWFCEKKCRRHCKWRKLNEWTRQLRWISLKLAMGMLLRVSTGLKGVLPEAWKPSLVSMQFKITCQIKLSSLIYRSVICTRFKIPTVTFCPYID